MSKARLLAVCLVLAGVAGFAWMSIYGLHNDPRSCRRPCWTSRSPSFRNLRWVSRNAC